MNRYAQFFLSDLYPVSILGYEPTPCNGQQNECFSNNKYFPSIWLFTKNVLFKKKFGLN
jgi:hypothetical protein